MAGSGIDAWRAKLDPADLLTVDRLRALAAACAPNIAERIKWNAPSFARGDVDRITLGLERKGGVRVVLHRGAKAHAAVALDFDAPADLVSWPAPDRCVMRFQSAAEVDKRAGEIGDVFRRWMEID